MPQSEVIEVKVQSDERIGEGGFLVLRRLVLVNRRADGSDSASYRCDFVERPYGLDAVAMVVYRSGPSGTEVLLRRGLRPPLAFGRDVSVPIQDLDRSPFCIEIAAGLIENEDVGADGIRDRAVAEIREELGHDVVPADLVSLGAAVVPTPSVIPEKLYLYAVKLAGDAVANEPEGDGSPMEEGATSSWWTLADAIAACVGGEICDAKTEIGLRRLRDQLAASEEAIAS